MAHMTYEEAKKNVFKGLALLGGVTLLEVFISLLGKGYVIEGVEKYKALLYLAGLVIIVLSLYKAYFIIYEFMHMRYEVKSLAMTVLLPVTLLIWAVIAFFQEGDSWKNRRELINEKNALPPVEEKATEGPQGLQWQVPDDTYLLGEIG